MELPQPKPLGTEGRKPTHDFLSLYPSSNAQQDPTPSQGNYIKTHDFLQPLERVMRKNTTKETIENPPCSSVEHVLPGGIGTYTISYSQKFPTKSDHGILFASNNTTTKNNDENSNISISYPGNTFTIWDASASARKGKTGGKENMASERPIPRVAGLNGTLSQSSSTKTFSSFSDFHPSSSSSHKNQSFMDMITSAKNDQEDEDDYDDDDEFVVKKEPTQSPSKGNVSVKVEAKTTDQKPNTPRSKHSATEQRRRSKINDRFQKLREIVPNSDQKRDKASFLLEVIEYVQFLQGKVNRYEGSYNVWNRETSKMMQRRNHYSDESIIMDRARGLNTFPVVPAISLHSTQSEEKKSVISPMIIGQNLAQSDTNSSCERGKQQQELTIESGRINISSAYSQGLLNTLTRALQSSGVDLSQATISVQIDIGNGKRYNAKDSDASTSAGEDLGPTLKRHKSS